MAPPAGTGDESSLDIPCHCKDCDEFRLAYDTLWALFEKPRPTDGVTNGVADSLWDAWQSTEKAWAINQRHPQHVFVQAPSSSPEAHHDTCSDHCSERNEEDSVPEGHEKHQYNRRNTDPTHRDNGGYHGRFAVCDHCRSHSLTCNEASVCNQCELHGLPCVHRECKEADRKEDCSNLECRYIHRKSLDARSINDPRWIIMPGKLAGFRERGFRLDMLLRDLLRPDSMERFDLLQPRQSAFIQAANASELPLDALHHECDCSIVDEDEFRDQADDDEGTFADNDFETEDGSTFRQAAQCSVCNSSGSALWAVTPCYTRICFDCALRKCLGAREFCCVCQEADGCSFLILENSETWYYEVPERLIVSRKYGIYSESKWVRDYASRELNRLRRG